MMCALLPMAPIRMADWQLDMELLNHNVITVHNVISTYMGDGPTHLGSAVRVPHQQHCEVDEGLV